MRNNPAYADTVLFDAGVTLTVPQVPTAASNVSNTAWGTFFQTA